MVIGEDGVFIKYLYVCVFAHSIAVLKYTPSAKTVKAGLYFPRWEKGETFPNIVNIIKLYELNQVSSQDIFIEMIVEIQQENSMKRNKNMVCEDVRNISHPSQM